MGSLVLPGGPSCKVLVHPVVLYAICDAYIRRDEGKPRVVGTLLGTTSPDGVVHVNECYAVPHKEEEGQELMMDLVHQKTLLELHQKVNPKQGVVGWFSTYPSVTTADNLFHSFFTQQYQQERGPPIVLLTVDCLLHDGPLGMHAYVSRPLDLPTSQDGVGMLFAETECRIVTDDLEVLGPNVITALEAPAQGDDTGRVQRALEQLRLLVDGMLAYVDGVCEGRIRADTAVGRYLASSVAALPRMSQEEMRQICADGAQDVVLATYLAHLLRTHVALGEKLGTAQLPIM